MDEVREKYLAWTVTTGEQIIEWAKPNADWPASPASSWPLTDFTSAVTIALCESKLLLDYLTRIYICFIFTYIYI